MAAGAGGTAAPDGAIALRRTMLVVAAGLVATGLGWPTMLGRYTLGLFLKNQLHLLPQQTAIFWAVGTLAWYVKPLAGLLCDGVPLFGTRRRGYLVAGGLAATALWATLALAPPTYGALLGAVVALNVVLMLVSATTGGLLVEVGQRHGATGRLSGLRMAVEGAVALVAGPLGAWLAARAFGWTGAVGAAIVFALVPVALLGLREPGVAVRAIDWAAVWRPARVAARSRPLWAVVAFTFVAFLPPGFQTALFYRQQDVLKLDAAAMGNLQMLGGAGSLVGAAIYVLVCRRFPLRRLLPVGIVLNVLSTAIYVGYDSWPAAVAIALSSSVMGMLALAPLFDLAARAIPTGGEGFGYALVLTAQNVAGLAIAEPLGATLYGRSLVGFSSLVWINTAVTAATLLLVPLLPAALLADRDR